MIQKLIFHNPITNNIDSINIEYGNIDYITWKRTKDYNSDNDITQILDSLIKYLDCAINSVCGRLCMTHYPKYIYHVNEYYRYCIKLSNQFLYNIYVNKLIKRHIANIVFEYNNPVIIVEKNKKVKRKSIINRYIREVYNDMFTENKQYRYYNPKTGHEIVSEKENLLDELNNKSNKVKKDKVNNKCGVPISAMTFSFKKK